MVKVLNNNAVAIKMVDNPPDLQTVIPNEIIIISTKRKKEHLCVFPLNNLYHCRALMQRGIRGIFLITEMFKLTSYREKKH